MWAFLFSPMDTLFFRDGTPYTLENSPQEDVASTFPPGPRTIAGAVRAALARTNGWSGSGGWSPEIAEVLGDGPDDAGKLQFEGPFLTKDDQVWFRAPRHLLCKQDGGSYQGVSFLEPGPSVVCDLGHVRLPVAPDSPNSREPLGFVGDKLWLNANGMNRVLRGALPEKGEILQDEHFWVEETRIGLERDRGTRTAISGRLFSGRHVRLKHGVALLSRVSGIPTDYCSPSGQVVSLGGENRGAEFNEYRGRLSLQMPVDQIENSKNLTIVALTPLDIDQDVISGKKPLEELGGAVVVSGCVGSRQYIGGWDSKTHTSLPLRGWVPPGSVLFCKVIDVAPIRRIGSSVDKFPQLGRNQQLGFGVVAFGTWNETMEVL